MALPNGMSGATQYGAFDGEHLAVDSMGWLSQHDIVYKRPPNRPDDGVPIGNGAMGGLVWVEQGCVRLQVNSTEHWARTPARPFGGLLTGASFSIGSEPSALSGPTEFIQRLDLGQAATEIVSSSGAGQCRAKVWAPATSAVIVLEYADTYVRAKRRTLSTHGARKARSFAIDTFAGVSEETEDRRLAVVARVIGTPAEPWAPDGQPALRLDSPRGVSLRIVIAAACVGPDRDPVREATLRIDAALRQGLEALYREHRAHWRNFWRKSFLKLRSEDALAEYAENLWHLHLYQMASCSRGEVPPVPAGGLWRTEEPPIASDDAALHWSTQAAYWPMATANHLELLQPFHAALQNALPIAERLAKERGVSEGAWFPAVLSRSGEALPVHELDTGSVMLGTGIEYAMSLWWTWQHIQDPLYLREMVYPVLGKCTQFLLESAEFPAGGPFRLPHADAYLRRLNCANATPDLAALRFALGALVQAAEVLDLEPSERDRWRRALASLPSYPLRAEQDVWDDGEGGVPGMEIGRPDLAPIFPSGVVGLGSAEHGRAARTLALGFGANPYVGWSNEPVCAARLGLGDEFAEFVRHHIRHCQFGAQGFFHRIPEPEYLGPALDSGGALAVALIEACLQSHDGVLRVFPALPRNWDSAFQLRAAGGFVVMGETTGGIAAWLAIRSLCGGPARLRNPWLEHLRISAGGKEILRSAAPVVEFATSRDQTYLVERCSRPLSRRMTTRLTGVRNDAPKRCGPRRLGRE